MTPLVEVVRLVKDFGTVPAVAGVSFTIGSGETLGLIGESGSGKTTTGRCLLRLTEPTSGTLLFDGVDIRRLRRRALRRWRQQAQIIFQDPYGSLNPRMTVGQAVAEPLLVHGACPRSAVAGRVGQVLEQVGLSAEDARRFPHEFSGGQRQRVAIARAVVIRPRLVVVDEALSALDATVQIQILALLHRLQKDIGVSYLFVSHNLNAVRYLAHRTAVMYAGRIVEVGPTSALFTRPMHPYTQALLAANAAPDPSLPRLVQTPGEVPEFGARAAGCPYHPLCPHSSERCRVAEPLLRSAEDGREVACHLFDLQMLPSG